MSDEETNAVLDIMDLIYEDPTTDPDVDAHAVRAVAMSIVLARLAAGVN